MNERIKQLAKDYLLHERFTRYGESIQEDYYEMYPDELEKFAALIIQECIDIVKPTGHHEVWAQSYLGGVDGLDLLYSKIKDIKQHFGVEE